MSLHTVSTFLFHLRRSVCIGVYVRLGVDCESMNPTALGFWSKYFDAYTHSVVRRIDENAIALADG